MGFISDYRSLDWIRHSNFSAGRRFSRKYSADCDGHDARHCFHRIQDSESKPSNLTSGYILINKPSGPTSHDVVDEVRFLSGMREVGHAGTLDPLAEGLLILLVGSFTKKFQEFMKLSKEYEATLRLGIESDTHDAEGEIKLKKEFSIPIREEVENVLEKFRGKIKQVPPQFSAIKKGGRKAYEEARRGKELSLEARIVTVSKIETIWYKFPLLTLDFNVSSGTYIRALARDIGEALGTGAILLHLCRKAIGPYRLENAVRLKALTSKNWQEFLITDTAK